MPRLASASVEFKPAKWIHFLKVAGAGNDFILIDVTLHPLPEEGARLSTALCRQHLGIGADGLMLLEQIESATFRLSCFNPDGSTATMCGNAVRCAAMYSMDWYGVSRPTIMMEEREYRAYRNAEGISVSFVEPEAYHGPLVLNGRESYYIHTGTEHVVIFTESVKEEQVEVLGMAVRSHSSLAPVGANVNFVEVVTTDTIRVRTYERGVEAETLSCGSGAVASALVARHLGILEKQSITVLNRTQTPLRVDISGERLPFRDIFLTGPAQLIYEGKLEWNTAWKGLVP